MTSIKKGLLLLLLPLFAFTIVHKFYVSVTNIEYYEKEDALQITSRLFTDDFEKVLEERYEINAQLATPEELSTADGFIQKYFQARFLVKINGQDVPFQFLGKQFDNDLMICYLEIPRIKLEQVKSIEIQNELLMDLFEEQKNILHFKIKDQKKSFVLIRENNKGMLNLE
jgi:hypothetical protein